MTIWEVETTGRSAGWRRPPDSRYLAGQGAIIAVLRRRRRPRQLRREEGREMITRFVTVYSGQTDLLARGPNAMSHMPATRSSSR
jgi:hypothetical protein